MNESRDEAITAPLSLHGLPGSGGEDVLIEQDGSVVTGLGNGDVVRLTTDGTAVLGNTGGRPLGLEACADGTLLVCDHDKGLLRVDPATGRVTVVLNEIDGAPLRFCSNAARSEDGSIYLTTSSETATWDDYQADAIAHATSGKLIRVHPNGDTTVLDRNLSFANGIALAPDESCLYVAETLGYRIRRYWLKGERAGTWSDFVTGLHGFPDNISLSSTGLLWVALPAPRIALLDFLLPRHPALRTLALKLPRVLQPRPKRIVWVQAYDLDGRLVYNIRMRHRGFSFVTAVAQSEGTLWLASVRHAALARLALPPRNVTV
ncbi:SMP-30/gluconolactonase/LRE family protein [Methyloceanibacter sp. wino2]|uniref:SMP-30/gluconolactonase/LRE family protein n=1 Tax=Methyloceanibacter sp. wino2 TaxID=2170729 RepID=UPI00131F391C|nr:SMP-30/gluconolactonase/LRE family protein [Methyloceanibacter sp. wino2]